MSNSRNGLAALTVLVVIIAFADRAQSPSARFSISGVVQDQLGAAIVGARVELGAASITGLQSITTDQSGRDEFKRIASGTYQLRVSAPAVESTMLDVTVGYESPAHLQVVLVIYSLRQETPVVSEHATISTER